MSGSTLSLLWLCSPSMTLQENIRAAIDRHVQRFDVRPTRCEVSRSMLELRDCPAQVDGVTVITARLPARHLLISNHVGDRAGSTS